MEPDGFKKETEIPKEPPEKKGAGDTADKEPEPEQQQAPSMSSVRLAEKHVW